MKSHTCFRFVPIPMTLNDLERCNSPYFAFLTEFDSFVDRLCHSGWSQTYNISKILSLSSSLPLSAKTNVPCARSLCDSWASCHKFDRQKYVREMCCFCAWDFYYTELTPMLTVARKRTCGGKLLRQVFLHSLAKLCMKKNENRSIFVKVTAKNQ